MKHQSSIDRLTVKSWSSRKRLLQKSQQGMGLATAIFVITVMALLAVLIFQLIRNNAETTEEEILLVRSFYAAESGVQFGLNEIFPPDGTASNCPAVLTPPYVHTYPAYQLAEDGLNACTAEVTCVQLYEPVTDGTYYTVTSKGTCGGVSRTIQVRAE